MHESILPQAVFVDFINFAPELKFAPSLVAHETKLVEERIYS